MRKTLSSGFVLLILFTLCISPTLAQTTSGAFLFLINTDEFPRVTALLDIYDPYGNFIRDLSSGDVEIIENDVAINLDGLEDLHPGAQIVVAVNLGHPLAIRNAEGISRFDHLKTAISDWANRVSPDNGDNYSIVASDGMEQVHLDGARFWSQRVAEYDPDAREAVPSLDILVRAIEVASDPVDEPGTGKAILLITPPADQASASTLESLASQAIQNDIRIFTWVVTSEDGLASQGVDLYRQLSADTGGQFFAFTGEEAIPDPDTYFEPLRHTYRLHYTSQIIQSGDHSIRINIKTDSGLVESQAEIIPLEVLPPNPIFLNTPAEILRAYDEDSLGNPADPGTFLPASQNIEIIVEFPDGHSRPLQRTTLYANNEIIAENTTDPFNVFIWDIKSITTTSTSVLVVEAVDSLGLSSVSIETPVNIVIRQTPQSVIASYQKYFPAAAVLLLFLLISIAILLMILKGRISPRTFGRLKTDQPGSFFERRRAKKDPVSQPLQIQQDASTHNNNRWMNRISWPNQEIDKESIAYLEPALEPHEISPADQIPLHGEEITFGSDPALSTIPLDDPTVDDLHARLWMDKEKRFWIKDEGSIAGTWIYHIEAADEGTMLQHNDLVNIADVQFRFKFRDTSSLPKPVIKPHNGEL